MALFLNSDKLIISSLEIFYDQETYFYLFFIILAIHRFLTTPFIMRYSPQYYQASDNVIPARVILIGISMIITSSVTSGSSAEGSTAAKLCAYLSFRIFVFGCSSVYT